MSPLTQHILEGKELPNTVVIYGKRTPAILDRRSLSRHPEDHILPLKKPQQNPLIPPIVITIEPQKNPWETLVNIFSVCH